MPDVRYVTYEEFQEFKHHDVRDLKEQVQEVQKNVDNLARDMVEVKVELRHQGEAITGLTNTLDRYKNWLFLAVVIPLADVIVRNVVATGLGKILVNWVGTIIAGR